MTDLPHVDTPTSEAAAESMQSRVATLRQQVLDHIRAQGARGATDEEIQDALAMNPSTERPRRIELVARVLVRDGDITRPTRSGRRAVVWVARPTSEAPRPAPEAPPGLLFDYGPVRPK